MPGAGVNGERHGENVRGAGMACGVAAGNRKIMT
jgi:hypothetical protein